MHKSIMYNNKAITLSKSVKGVDYKSKSILTDSIWEYVELWLMRCKQKESQTALFFWQQAKSFYQASLMLPLTARPLTSYYCCLNAAKALLITNSVPLSNLGKHGVGSNRDTVKGSNLSNYKVNFQGSGVLSELVKYYAENESKNEYTIYELLYNVPIVHRAFVHTYSQSTELFIPIKSPTFVKKSIGNESWLQFEIVGRHRNINSLKRLPSNFEKDNSIPESFVYRVKKRFEWDIHKSINQRFEKLLSYQRLYQKHFFYISGNETLWYIKKDKNSCNNYIERHNITLTFAAMHWLSELVRYKPETFEKLMKSKQNWLLSEFINMGLDQFIDEIASEITGQNIANTKVRSK